MGGGAFPLRHTREPARRIELRLPPYRGDVLPLPLSRRVFVATRATRASSWPGWTRTSVVPTFKAPSSLPSEQPARALSQCRPGRPAFTRGWRAPVQRAFRCARPDLNRDAPRGALAPRASASTVPPRTQSRHPVPTRVIRRTKAEPQPCAAAWLPGVDSNHRRHDPESCWGLRRPTRKRYAGRDLNPQTARFELASFAG